MTRALLALLLLVGGGSPFLSASGMATLQAVVASVGGHFDPDGGPSTNVGSQWDPNGSPATQNETDVGSQWDPDG